MAACRVAPEIKASKTFQDILDHSWNICHLNVIYIHRMLLLKIVLLYKKALHYAVYGHMLPISLHAICTTYMCFLLLGIKMHRVHMYNIYIYIYTYMWAMDMMDCLYQHNGTETETIENCPLQAVKVLFSRL